MHKVLKRPVNDYKFGVCRSKENWKKNHELALVQKGIQQEPLDKEDIM